MKKKDTLFKVTYKEETIELNSMVKVVSEFIFELLLLKNILVHVVNMYI